MMTTRWPAHSVFFLTALFAWAFPALGLPLVAGGFAIFGFQHGALDFAILKKLKRSIPKYVAQYVIVMIAYALVFLNLPALATAFFLVLSSYHFGIDALGFAVKSDERLRGTLVPCLFGFALLSVAVFSHLQPAERIITLIESGSSSTPIGPSSSSELFATLVSVLAAASAVLIAAVVSRKRSFVIQVFALVISLFILPLEIGFGLFFVYWHSVDSLAEQKTRLRLTATDVMKKSGLLSAGAMLAIAGAAFLERPAENTLLNIHFVFMAVGALSVAHILMSPSVKQVRDSLQLSNERRLPSGSSS